MLKNPRGSTTAAVLFLFAIFFNLSAAPSHAANAGVKPVYTPAETKEFKGLANDTIHAIESGNEKQMVAKITDLETAWDAKEDTLKPRDQATWTSIDKTLDKGISAIRGSKPDLEKGKAALKNLVTMLEQATKPEK
jgi:hypothetical protein